MSSQRVLEVQLLSAAKHNKESAVIVSKSLNGYQFSDAGLDWIWAHIKSGLKRGELTRVETLQAMIKTEALDAHEPLIEAVLEVWGTYPTPTPGNDCEALKRYAQHDQLTSGIDRAVKSITRGDLDGARAIMARTGTEATATDHAKLRVASLMDWDEWNSIEGQKGIPTGIWSFDDAMMGGMYRKDLLVMFGVTNMGKSILAVNFGFTAIAHRLKVLHVDSENGEDLTRWRYISRMTGYPTNGLRRRRAAYPGLEDWARRNKARIDKQLRIVPIGVDTTTRDELETRVNEIVEDEGEDGFKPDVIICDTVDHIRRDDKDQTDNMALYLKGLYEWNKGWVERLNACGYTVTQGGKDGEGKISTNKNVAWGYDKARIATAILTINPGLDDRGRPLPEAKMGNKRTLFVGKSRSSAARFLIPMTTAFHRAYMSEDLDVPDPNKERPAEEVDD